MARRMLLEAGNQKGGGLRLKKWLIGIFVFLIFLLAINSFILGQFHIISFSITVKQASEAENKPEDWKSISSVENGYVVNSNGCRIPDLSPFEPPVWRYIRKAKPIVCDHGTHLPLVDSNNSAIFVDPAARSHYYNESESIDCCWRHFWRTNKDNEFTISKDCHRFKQAAHINEEFVKVECNRKNESIYRDYFAFAPRKIYVEERCHKILKKIYPNPEGKTSVEGEPISVLMVGIDSVSRLNLHRSMPRTVQWLQNRGAVEMLGYNKVADNTYPNIVPVLSGLSHGQFEKLCWKNHSMPFDNCPLIFKNFEAKGYRTIFAEDACFITIFNYLKPGFRKQPTDYYLRPYCIASETDIGNTHHLNTDLCMGTRLTFDTLMHYTRKVVDEFSGDPYFGFFWQTSLTHDYVEYTQLADNSYFDFFNHLSKNNLLRNTALVFMSDHGMRWGSFRQTYQGHLEDRLPFVFVLMPDWWRIKHASSWEMMKRNTRRLTTPFDLHETLRDILEPNRVSSEPIANKLVREKTGLDYRGISMFKAIPEDRTCNMAGIPENWCTCHEHLNVSLSEPIVNKVADFILSEINAMLEKYPQCAQLYLASIKDAKVLSNKMSEKHKREEDKQKKAPWFDYTVIVKAIPGNAVLEGTTRYRTDNGNMSLMGSVSRLNTYGTQSICVDDFLMRLYCYCQ